ncbi:MAG: protein-glutamate O-methyltransferase CheR [Nitrospinae bacterium]|nr:protein-glutamate O-methyltransferase CheR [Nitrospinota bacterium]
MAINPTDFDYISKIVKEESAIVLEKGKEYLVESRLMPLVHQEKLESLENLVRQLKAQPRGPLRDTVIEAMTTNETSFFRDIHPFETLKKEILPDLMEKRKDKKELNIWCGASSSGQECYSLVMTLKNSFPALDSWKISYFASDISNQMLNRCRSGIYSQLEINRGLPAPLMVKYFQRLGTEWQVKEELRKMIQFRITNLSEKWPYMPPLDLIMMRNVLIYFDVEMKKDILGRARKLLKPDGYLFLGAAETTLNLDDNFERMPFKQSGCYRLKQG